MCIRPKGRTQCIFPRSQHTCMYIYWPKVNLYPAVGFEHCSNHSLFCKCFFFKWPPVAILDVQKSLLTISDQYHNFYFCDFFHKMAAGDHFGCISGLTKWLPSAILDVRNSVSIIFLAILDQYGIFIFFIFFYKMAPGVDILDVRNSLSIAFLAISDLLAILDFRKSLSIAFLAISDRSAILDVRNSLSMAFLAFF